MSTPIEEDDSENGKGKDRMPALNRQKEPSIATCFGLEIEVDETLTRYLGTEIVQKPPPSTKLPSIPVHKALLCRYSRYFLKKFGNPFEEKIISEALDEILFYKENYFPTYEPCCTAGALCHTCSVMTRTSEDSPSCYIRSSVVAMENWRHLVVDDDLGDRQQQEQEGEILVDEHPSDFYNLVEWLYRQKLGIVAACGRSIAQVYTQLYAMAERLDIPTLRQTLYSKLTKDYYYSMETLPDVKVAKVIINECSPSSLLRKYIIAMLAYVMIDPESKKPKKDAKLILDLDKDFAAAVAEEVMRRLGSEKGSEYPCDLDEYEVDDSDSDVGSSIDVGSDIQYDSDGYISSSESEDDLEEDGEQLPENVVGEPAGEEEDDIATPINHPVHVTSIPVDPRVITQPSNINGEIKSESASSLSPSIGNKRKRGPSEVTGPSKRVQSPDEVEFMDLTNSSP